MRKLAVCVDFWSIDKVVMCYTFARVSVFTWFRICGACLCIMVTRKPDDCGHFIAGLAMAFWWWGGLLIRLSVRVSVYVCFYV